MLLRSCSVLQHPAPSDSTHNPHNGPCGWALGLGCCVAVILVAVAWLPAPINTHIPRGLPVAQAGFGGSVTPTKPRRVIEVASPQVECTHVVRLRRLPHATSKELQPDGRREMRSPPSSLPPTCNNPASQISPVLPDSHTCVITLALCSMPCYPHPPCSWLASKLLCQRHIGSSRRTTPISSV